MLLPFDCLLSGHGTSGQPEYKGAYISQIVFDGAGGALLLPQMLALAGNLFGCDCVSIHTKPSHQSNIPILT